MPEFRPGEATVGALREAFLAASPSAARLGKRILVAVNESFADSGAHRRHGGLPAAVGGGLSVARVTRSPLDPAVFLSEARRDGDGGLTLFVGVVRDNADGRAVEAMEYEAYEPMAEKEMERIEADLATVPRRPDR